MASRLHVAMQHYGKSLRGQTKLDCTVAIASSDGGGITTAPQLGQATFVCGSSVLARVVAKSAGNSWHTSFTIFPNNLFRDNVPGYSPRRE